MQGKVPGPSRATPALAVDAEMPSVHPQPEQQRPHMTEGVADEGRGKRKRQATEKYAQLQQESHVRS